MWFNIYLAFLSYLQFTYQRGCLYRLKSLGLRNNEMDITIDGFHSWMWKGIYNFKFWASRAGQLRFVSSTKKWNRSLNELWSFSPFHQETIQGPARGYGRITHFLPLQGHHFKTRWKIWTFSIHWYLIVYSRSSGLVRSEKMNFLPSAEHSTLKTIIQNAPI